MRDPLLTLVLAVIAASCGPSDKGAPQGPPPTAAAAATATPPGAAGMPHIASIEIGRSVNPDSTMHDATMLFIPTDDVWASVIVEGNAPRATLQARWLTDGGGVLEQSSQEITPTGRTVVAFHAAARPGGWPLGRYKLELVDEAGRTNKIPPDFVFVALENQRPKLKLKAPHGDQRVSALEEVAFNAQALVCHST